MRQFTIAGKVRRADLSGKAQVTIANKVWRASNKAKRKANKAARENYRRMIGLDPDK